MDKCCIKEIIDICNANANIISLLLLMLNLLLIYLTVRYTQKSIARQTTLGLLDRRLEVYNVAFDYIRNQCEILKATIDDKKDANKIRSMFFNIVKLPGKTIEKDGFHILVLLHLQKKNNNNQTIEFDNEIRTKIANTFIHYKTKMFSERAVLKRSEFLFDLSIYEELEKMTDAYFAMFCAAYVHDFTDEEDEEVINSYENLLNVLNEIEERDLLGRMKNYLKIKE